MKPLVKSMEAADKSLHYSLDEACDVANTYTGNVVTDHCGFAYVEVPDWFEALNRDFCYQLTVIGQFAQAMVLRKLHDNRFVIKTDRPGVEVSWQVTGIYGHTMAGTRSENLGEDESVMEHRIENREIERSTVLPGAGDGIACEFSLNRGSQYAGQGSTN